MLKEMHQQRLSLGDTSLLLGCSIRGCLLPPPAAAALPNALSSATFFCVIKWQEGSSGSCFCWQRPKERWKSRMKWETVEESQDLRQLICKHGIILWWQWQHAQGNENRQRDGSTRIPLSDSAMYNMRKRSRKEGLGNVESSTTLDYRNRKLERHTSSIDEHIVCRNRTYYSKSPNLTQG